MLFAPSQINDWILANKLSLNVEQVKYVLFHIVSDQLPSLQLNGNIIEKENSFKFLDVTLDEDLTWKKHMQFIENKVSKMVVF